MSDAEIDDFLRNCPDQAHCGTVNPNGSSHVGPVWYDFNDDGAITMTMIGGTRKVKNLMRDLRFSLSIESSDPEMAFVQINRTSSSIRTRRATRYRRLRLYARHVQQSRRNPQKGTDLCVPRTQTSSLWNYSEDERVASRSLPAGVG
ncbi:MAG: hypothetical protein ACI915_005341, partial [Gammaproteobacteria bacterium]